MSKSFLTTLDGHPSFNKVVFQEALTLVSLLPPDVICRHALKYSNCPTAADRLAASTGVRSLSSSSFLFRAEPEGTMASLLFYLVSLCEGVLMPILQLFITLAEIEGHTGTKKDLKAARKHFGPAISLLAGPGQASLASRAPEIAARLTKFHESHLSDFRNSVAHFKFFLDLSMKSFNEVVKESNLPEQSHLQLYKFFVASKNMLGIPPHPNRSDDMLIDMDKSIVRYEESLNRPITYQSRCLTFQEAVDYIYEIEKFAYSCSFAEVEHGANLQAARIIKSTACSKCSATRIWAPAAEMRATCPGCDSAVQFETFEKPPEEVAFLRPEQP